MNIAKRYSIAWKGLKPGLHTFDFKVDDALFESFESPEILGGACDVHVALTRGESMLDAAVRIEGGVRVACDRCLEECRIPVDFDGRLVVRISEQEGEYDGEVMWVSPRQDEIDLAQYIYESIVLSLPYQRVHPEGECDPDMLARFRYATELEIEQLEARAEADDPSALTDEARNRLAALKRRMESTDKKSEK